MPPCLTLGNIRYLSRVKWSNLGKEVAPSPTLWCNSFWKGSLLVALDYGRQPTMCIKMNLALNNLEWLICYKTKPSVLSPAIVKLDRLGSLTLEKEKSQFKLKNWACVTSCSCKLVSVYIYIYIERERD